MKWLYNKCISLVGEEVFLYVLFGVLTTVINFITYYICNVIFEINTGISTTIAFILGVIFAYVTNRKYVFKSKVTGINKILKEIGEFFLARIFTYVVDLGLMILLVDVYHFNSIITKLLVNILVIILNYVFSKLIVFKKR